ncbi:MAG: NB-ARC domain-containing protein [Chloroflexota bacterium]
MSEPISSTSDTLPPLAQLREQIASHFNLEGLRTLCVDVNVNFDELPNPGLTPKIRDLIQVMWRRGRIETLLTAVTRTYPHVSWPDLAALQADTSVDSALTAAYEKLAVWAGVPPMPPNFLGRDELIASLIDRLTNGDNLALSAEGQPGVGKTALAVALAHHHEVLAHFQDGILWAGLGKQADVFSVQAEWADALGQDITHLADVAERERVLQRAIGQRRMLLVLDDAWELAAAKALRCGGPHCCHLLTTRDKGLARAFAGATRTAYVPTLDDDPAFALLQKLAPEACQADPQTARQLAQAVDGSPLALNY